jgi:2-methylcitrate dehydratase PrpD
LRKYVRTNFCVKYFPKGSIALGRAAQDMSLTEELQAILSRPVDAAARERACLHLVDWLGCALIGRRSETAAVFERELLPETIGDLIAGGSDPARLALAAGSFGSILEMDDVHRTAILHPGPVVFPAALAAAGKTSGRQFLDAVIRGYEAMIRLGIAVGAGHYAFFHNTATCGGFGSAAAAGELMGLGEQQKVWALGNAMSVAGGLWQCRNEPVMTKPFHCADAARRGVQAARMAAAGLTGPRFILEGPQGLFAASCPGSDPRVLVRDPEAAWLIGETSFKPWPACRHAHAAIDAALALRARIDPKAIRAIDIQAYADAVTFCDRSAPETENQAKFSLQHSVAVVFADGLPTLAAFKPEVLSRADYAHYRRLASVREDDRLSSAYPSHFGSAVTVELADGSRLTENVPDALGDSENPLSADAVVAKSLDLMAQAGIDAGLAARLVDQAKDLAGGGSFAAFRSSLAEAFRTAA